MVYLEDGEIASLSLGKEMDLKTIDNVTKTYIQELEMHLEAIEKGGFDHFMLKKYLSNLFRSKTVYEVE